MPYDHLASIPKGKTAQATLEVHPIPSPLHVALHSHGSYSTLLSLPCYGSRGNGESFVALVVH